MKWLLYICAGVGAVIICLLLWVMVLEPFIHYIKRLYIFYVLKKIRVAHYETVYSYILGPNSVETMTRKEFKEKYGFDAKFKDCY
jgi:hypothetical protein